MRNKSSVTKEKTLFFCMFFICCGPALVALVQKNAQTCKKNTVSLSPADSHRLRVMTLARPHPLLFSAVLHMREVQGMPLVSLTALLKSSWVQISIKCKEDRDFVLLWPRWSFLTTSRRTKSSEALTNHNNYNITASPPLPIVPELLLEAFQLVLHVCAPVQLAVQLKSVKSL